MNSLIKRAFMVGGGDTKLNTFGGLMISNGYAVYSSSPSTYYVTDDWRSVRMLSNPAASLSSRHSFSCDGYSDWFVPSYSDYANIMSDSRPGAIINNNKGCRYARVQFTGITIGDTDTPLGYLLAPDKKKITDISTPLVWNDPSYLNTGITDYQIDEYVENGCAFFPAWGWYYLTGYNGRGTSLVYSTSDIREMKILQNVYRYLGYITFNQGSITNKERSYENEYKMPVRLVRWA